MNRSAKTAAGRWNFKMAEKDLRRFLKRENLADQQLEPAPDVATAATAANE